MVKLTKILILLFFSLCAFGQSKHHHTAGDTRWIDTIKTLYRFDSQLIIPNVKHCDTGWDSLNSICYVMDTLWVKTTIGWTPIVTSGGGGGGGINTIVAGSNLAGGGSSSSVSIWADTTAHHLATKTDLLIYQLTGNLVQTMGSPNSTTYLSTSGLNSYLNSAYYTKSASDARYIQTEVDPIYTASAAFGISGTDITHWNTAYDKYPTGLGFSGGTFTLTKRDGSTLTQSLDGRYQLLLGYTAEDQANKATSFSTLNNTLYPSTQAVATYVASFGYGTGSVTSVIVNPLSPIFTSSTATNTTTPVTTFTLTAASAYSYLGNSTSSSSVPTYNVIDYNHLSNLPSLTLTVNTVSMSVGNAYTITAAAGTLTGLTLASGVIGSSLTSVGTLTSGSLGSGFTAVADGQIASAATWNAKQAAISFGAGVLTWIGTPSSANLAAAMTDKTGTGALVFGTNPTLGGATFTDATNIVFNTTTGTKIGTATTQKIAFYNSTPIGQPSGNIIIALQNLGLISGGTLASGDIPVIVETRGGTNQTTYSTGDILYASASNTLSKLSIGSSAQLMIINSGIPSWQTVSGDITIGNTGITSVGASKILNSMIANTTIDLTAKVTGLLPSSNIGSITGGQVGISGLSATGTPSSTTYLRGDNTWATVSAGTTYTWSTGLTNSTNTITSNISTGVSGGQTIYGGTTAGDQLIIQGSTTTNIGNVTTPVIQFNGNTLNGSNTAQVYALIQPTINATSTAGYTALKVNASETATGSGTKLLLDLLATGTSKFKVDNSGNNTSASITTGAVSATTGVFTGLLQLVGSGGSDFNQIGGFSTATSGTGYDRSNLWVTGFVSGTAQGAATFTGGSSTVQVRSIFNGNTSLSPSANNSAANVVFGAAAQTIPGSGTSAVFANVVVRAQTINTGAGTLTNAASLYIDGAPSAATNNYAFLINSGNLGVGGVVSKYNNVATVAWGVPAIYGTGRATAQTSANASVATYTVGAADGSFLISTNIYVTTSSAENFTMTCAYTDENNNARTQTIPFVLLAGTTVGAINFANGAVPYEGVSIRIRCKASTSITLATTGTFTGATYNVEGDITQMK